MPADEAGMSFETRAYRALARMSASDEHNPLRLCDLAVDVIRDLVEADAAVVRWWDPAAGGLRLLATNDSGLPPQAELIATDEGTTGLAFTCRRAVKVDDYPKHPGARPERIAAGLKSTMGAPLLVGDRVVGAASAVSYTRRSFSQAELELLALVCAQIAPALESARLLEEQARQAQTFRGLYELGVSAAGLQTMEEMARLAVDRAELIMGFGQAAVAWWYPDDERLVVIAGNWDAWTSRQEVSASNGAMGQAFTEARAVVIADYQAWTGALDKALAQGLRTIVAVPMLVGRRVVGVLAIKCYEPALIDNRQVEVLGLLTALVAPAIESARLVASVSSSESRLRSIYQSLACAVMVNDETGRVVEANRRSASILGTTVSDLIGRSASDLGVEFRSEDGSGARSLPSELARETGRPQHATVMQLVRPDGSARWIQAEAFPIVGDGGRVLQVVTSFVDVTGVKLAEEARQESEAKSRFLATMSHELRTPLNSVLGYAQLLQILGSKGMGPQELRYVDNILTSGRHLLAVIEGILDVAKISAGRMDLSIQPIAVGGILREVAIQAAVLATQKNLSLAMPDTSLVVYADSLRLRQVLLNVLSNAIKFTNSGSIRVKCAVRGGAGVIEITDTGIGIGPADIDRVFEDFTQVTTGKTRSYGGTGLGLPLSRSLLELMGGALAIRSRLGKGTVATITLPLATL